LPRRVVMAKPAGLRQSSDPSLRAANAVWQSSTLILWTDWIAAAFGLMKLLAIRLSQHTLKGASTL